MRAVYFILSMYFCLMAVAQQTPPTLTIEQHLEDYDFAVKYIEDNYAGFSYWVVDSTRADYEATKASLRSEVERGERPSWDAIAAYTGWFSDFHMALSVFYPTTYPFTHFKRQFRSYEGLDPVPVACKVTDKTFLIRFPSCQGDPDMKWVKNSIKLFKKSRCENLILDIRFNDGGNDHMYEPYLKLLYDHEALTPKPEYRNTPQNLAYLKKVGWHPIVHKLAAENPDAGFLSLGSELIKYKKVDKAVRKAALIIDNAGSSGESMVLEIKACSYRTTTYGRDNTTGCLDFANLSYVFLPNSGLKLSVPMTRRTGLPESSVDKNGISPDVRINLPLPSKLTDNIDEWVIWVAEQLEKD